MTEIVSKRFIIDVDCPEDMEASAVEYALNHGLPSECTNIFVQEE